MAYNPLTDFLSLFRNTSGGIRSVQAPTLDVVLAALARAGIINMVVQTTAPTANQATTAWFLPATPSWSNEGTLYLWNAGAAAYQPATPALFYAFLQAGG